MYKVNQINLHLMSAMFGLRQFHRSVILVRSSFLLLNIVGDTNNGPL